MKWKLDTFDTAIFGIPSYKSVTLIQPIGTGFYSCFVPVDPAVCIKLTGFGFQLISIRNTYILDNLVHDEQLKKNDEYEIEQFHPSTAFSQKQIIAMCKPIWRFSRYYRDHSISQAKSLELYRQWVENSLYHEYADACFIARIGDSIIGLLTVKIKGTIGYIDLLGVLPEYHGKKIGSRLLIAAKKYVRLKDYMKMGVVTEGENIIANQFYQKHGFVLNNVELVYHCHV